MNEVCDMNGRQDKRKWRFGCGVKIMIETWLEEVSIDGFRKEPRW